MRTAFPRILACAAALTFVPAASAVAQDGAFGIGGRFAMIRGDAQADTSAERFTGGQIRARLSKRTAVELSLDIKTVRSTDLTVRTRDFPIQGSLLLYPVRAALSPPRVICWERPEGSVMSKLNFEQRFLSAATERVQPL